MNIQVKMRKHFYQIFIPWLNVGYNNSLLRFVYQVALTRRRQRGAY